MKTWTEFEEINLFEEYEAQWKKNLLNFLNNQKT